MNDPLGIGKMIKCIVVGDNDLKFIYSMYENPYYNSITRIENGKITGFNRN